MAGKHSTELEHNSTHKHVRVFDESSNRHFLAMTVHDKIHVFEGNVRKMIVHCADDTPSAFELYKDQKQQWLIWVATHQGNLYRKILHSVSKSDNELMENENGSNQSIFDDLLNENDVDLITDFCAKQCKVPNDVICEIGERDKVLSCDMEVSCISCATDVLAVICADKHDQVMLIYSMSALQSNMPANVAIRLPLPMCSFPSPKNSVSQVSRLTVVTSEKNCLSSSQVCIPSHLFSLLFGWEMSVRSLSVVLCCMTDGSVYFHPVDLTVRKPQTSWQLLCVVDSPVIDLLSMKVNRALTEQETVAAELHNALGLAVRTPSHTILDAFLVVGASGKCCLTTVMPALGSVAFSADCQKLVSMFTLPGSVGSVCCRDDVLYVSCLSHQIQKCRLMLVRQGGGERKQFSVDIKAEHLFTASVSFMWISGEVNSLVCQTVNGDLIEIDSEPPTDQSQNSMAPLQPSLKDLLLGVDISQDSLNQLKSVHLQYNAFLQQMNVAAHLLHQDPQGVGSQNPAPVSCKVTVQSETSYHAVKYHLLVEVANHSAVTLTKDWSLVAILREVTSRQKLTEPERDSSSTHSFPLFQDFDPSRQIYFKIPISYSTASCGMKVDISLVLHMPENLHEEICAQYAFRDCLFVPVATSVVDVFHFLHLKQAGSVLPSAADSQMCVERKVAELKHCGQSKCQCEKKPAGQVYSISEHISAENTHSSPVETLHLLLKDSQVKADQLNHPSCSLQAPCGSVLTMSVEPTTPLPNSSPINGDDGKTLTVTMKSSNISLLARARLALAWKVQVMNSKHRDMSVEEFCKMIRKTESRQQQLQEIQGRWERGDNTFPTTISDLCAMYEIIQNDTI